MSTPMIYKETSNGPFVRSIRDEMLKNREIHERYGELPEAAQESENARV